MTPPPDADLRPEAAPLDVEPTGRPGSLRTENLAIVFTDIVGYTSRTSRQSREENARMLAEHDRLLLPLVRAFGGRRVKSIGDALLLTFRSPTDSVLCGMAMQDQLARHNEGVAEAEKLVIRVAISLGEVRLERGDIFGEPVNMAARLEHETPPGEVWLTDAVQLSMNRAEVPLEEVGVRELRGLSQPVGIHRVRRSDSGLPFGGVALARAEATGIGRDFPLVPALNVGAWATAARQILWGDARRRRMALAALAAVALGLGVCGYVLSRPLARAERALRTGDGDRAMRLLEGTPETAASLAVRGRALHLEHRPADALSTWERAAKLDPAPLDRPDVLTPVAEELGGPRSQAAADLLALLGEPGMRALVEAAGSDAYRRRWAAVEALKRIGQEGRIDLRDLYLADLKVKDCTVVGRAAGKLADLGDTRAIEPLREVSQRKGLLGLTEACEVPAARAALKKLEKR